MAMKQINGTVILPANTPSTGGYYDDLELRLYYVDGLTETLDQTSQVSTSNEYLFTYDDIELQVKVKLIRVSTGQVLGDTYTRGVLPRSFEVPKTDANYFTDFINHCYTHDAGLAVAAVTANKWWSLVKEINNGLSLAVVSGGTIPHQVNHVVPTGNAYYKTQGIAQIAYSLGYYLENQPMASDKQGVADTLHSLLKWLSQKRNPNTTYTGLLIDGTGKYIDSSTFDPDYVDTYASTIANITAYFAFKQAGLVLNDTFTDVAESLKNSIGASLYNSSTDRFYLGIYPTGVNVGDNLETNLMGVFYLIDDEDSEAAEFLLNHIEANYKFVDVNLGVTGYKATTGDTKVWIEGSYMTAMAYHRIGNTTKYRAIVKDLNKLQDPSDGAFKNGIIKYGKWEIVPYKSVGSTAWSYMVNTVPNEIFNFNREINPVAGLIPVYYNSIMSDFFLKDDCELGETTDGIVFTVLPATFSSEVSQEAADEAAQDYLESEGQAYANTNGICSPTGSTVYGNEERNLWFTKNDCPSGQIGSFQLITVPANTYHSTESQFDANATADVWLIANGQQQANSTGLCLIPFHLVNIAPETVIMLDDNSVYLNFLATEAVDTDIFIDWEYTTNGGTTWIPSTGTTMYQGAQWTFSEYLTTLPSGGGAGLMVRVTDVTPEIGVNQKYTFADQDLGTAYDNVETSCIFYKNDCPSNSGTAVVYTVPAATYSSYISQNHADSVADADIQANGQAYANAHGSCNGVNIYFNTLQVSGFTKNDCVMGTGTTVSYSVPAGTYQSTVSLTEANNLALADIATNGQNYANANGFCVGTNDIIIYLDPRIEILGIKGFAYVKAVATQAVTTDITVSFNYTFNGTAFAGSSCVILAGQTESDETFVRTFKTLLPYDFDFNIYDINPSSHGGYNYIW